MADDYASSFYNGGVPLKGDKGDPGKDGSQGIPGPKGDAGPGPTNDQLLSAAAAALAANPPQKGDKGDPGAKGDKGDPGINGSTDANTLQGQPGSYYKDANTFGGQPPSYYTDIVTRLGYTPVNPASPAFSGAAKGTSVTMSSNGAIGAYEATGGSGTTWYNTGIRNDGNTWYLLFSNPVASQAAAQAATWNAKRPISVSLSTGNVSLDGDGTGGTNVGGSLTVNGATKSLGNLTVQKGSPALIVNTTDAGDSGINFLRNGVARWVLGDSQGNNILYANMFNASGAYVSTPFQIRMSDGVTNLNGLQILGNTAWHAGNDGAGSGLDADLFDGLDSNAFMLRWTGAWLTDSQGNQRFYFSPSAGATYARVSSSFRWQNTGNTDVMVLDEAGNLGCNGDVTAFSDARLKSNVRTIPGALSAVQRMRGVLFDKDGRASLGVIAQEVQQVFPEVVHTADDERGTLSVAYGNLVGVLIEAIKDLSAQVDTLKERLA